MSNKLLKTVYVETLRTGHEFDVTIDLVIPIMRSGPAPGFNDTGWFDGAIKTNLLSILLFYLDF
jgi:hypothetical protein